MRTAIATFQAEVFPRPAAVLSLAATAGFFFVRHAALAPVRRSHFHARHGPIRLPFARSVGLVAGERTA